MPRIDWSKPLKAEEILEMSPSRRYYLLHREEIRLKRNQQYYENREAILATARAKRQAILAAKEKENVVIHGGSPPVLPGTPGGVPGSVPCLVCEKCGRAF